MPGAEVSVRTPESSTIGGDVARPTRESNEAAYVFGRRLDRCLTAAKPCRANGAEGRPHRLADRAAGVKPYTLPRGAARRSCRAGLCGGPQPRDRVSLRR